ncbi:MAG: hypothetical protein J5659_01260 [Clostridia bacterium]|nr:hypothetical protein [Clostridia bacterium]
MGIDENRERLKKYRILISKIARLKNMLKLCPENERRYKCEIKNCIVERDNIENAISRVDGDVMTEILSLKYMCGKTLEEIALDICYSKRQTERLHLKALAAIKI